MKYKKNPKINWYRCHVDPAVMAELMKCSDWHGYRQALGHLGMWAVLGGLTYWAFRSVNAENWWWTVPLMLLGLFATGTVGAFFGGTACHELSHKTPFKNKKANDLFLRVFAFLGWWDHVWFRPSHIRHHQVTTHHDYDGEVVLPMRLDMEGIKFFWNLIGWNPFNTWRTLKVWYGRARGKMDSDWYEFVLPEENEELRRQHRNWARTVVFGHLALATIFLVTGQWILIFIVNLNGHYANWLQFLCGSPQHYGLQPNVPDHRLCCRTYTCSWLPGFLYWNMQYHIEHHMFPAVPFFNLPKLHRLIEHDLPPTPHGLWATWKQMLAIYRESKKNPNYCYVPPLPQRQEAERASDAQLEREAALAL